MIVTTTNSIEGKKITRYLGIITGEAILGIREAHEHTCMDPAPTTQGGTTKSTVGAYHKCITTKNHNLG